MVELEVGEVVLDRFNARDMTASQCATSFVLPYEYSMLSRGSNTLLIGPRGSGKTTLLKMLTPEGMEQWRREPVSELRPEPEFSGIYIPLDVQLADTLEKISESGIDEGAVAIAVESLFALHVYRHVTASVAWFCSSSERHSRESVVERTEEAALVGELAELWSTPVTVPTVGTLMSALRQRQVRATETWRRKILQWKFDGALPIEDVEVVDFDGGMKGSIECLVRRVSWAGARWAVLFDEIELAPVSLQSQLLQYLRQSDPILLFKLAISPYMDGFQGVRERLSASPMNDYQQVDLSEMDDDSMRRFSEEYFRAASTRRGLGNLSLTDALGVSILNPVSTGRHTSDVYRPSAVQTRRFLQLQRKDPSFSQYLALQNLNVQALSAAGESDARAPFRKARQVALVRDAYLSDMSSTQRRIKTRNDALRLYTGAETIVKLCEGNPRRLAFIVPLLLDSVGTREGSVPRGVQMASVAKTAAAFRSFLRGIPVSRGLAEILPRGVLTFVDLLAKRFHEELVAPLFTDDPIGAFTVPARPGPLVEELIALCVNSGALVQLSDEDYRGFGQVPSRMGSQESSRGKRFRLTYLLAPNAGLLVRICRANSLTTLLRQMSESGTAFEKDTARALLDPRERMF